MKQLMIDLETLATTPDAEILSIGWCLFILDDDPVIVKSGVWNCKPQPNRRVDGKTARWWLDQNKRAQEALTEPLPDTLSVALTGLRNLIAEEQPGYIWANGVSFDLAILRNAFGGKQPWQYWQEACLRSVRALAHAVGLDYSEWYKDNPVPHSAEHDAIGQAEFLIEFFGRAREAGYSLGDK